MRKGDWKLIGNPKDTSNKAEVTDNFFLSNLAEDVTEVRNLASEHPEIVKQLTERHEAWIREVE